MSLFIYYSLLHIICSYCLWERGKRVSVQRDEAERAERKRKWEFFFRGLRQERHLLKRVLMRQMFWDLQKEMEQSGRGTLFKVLMSFVLHYYYSLLLSIIIIFIIIIIIILLKRALMCSILQRAHLLLFIVCLILFIFIRVPYSLYYWEEKERQCGPLCPDIIIWCLREKREERIVQRGMFLLLRGPELPERFYCPCPLMMSAGRVLECLWVGPKIRKVQCLRERECKS